MSGRAKPTQLSPRRCFVRSGRGSVGMPVRVSALGIPRDALPQIVERSLKNFNADPKREFVRERDMLLALIQACW